MAIRTRAIEYKIYVNDREDELIKERMEKTNISNKSDYARKMMIDGLIINTDYSPVKELAMQISKVGNNINQIARQVNQMKNISKDEIDELKEMLNIISSHQSKTLKALMKGMK